MLVQDILPRLNGIKGGNGQWYAQCPAHDDRHQSLSISQGADGRTLLHCHANCSTEDVAAAIGLTVKDLFQSEKPRERAAVTDIYRYVDENGVLLAEKLRKSDKSFSWRRPVNGGWEYNRKGVPHTLYMAGGKSDFAFVVEGEKDADNLAGLGFFSVSGADGAGPGKWRAEYVNQLDNKSVVIFQDHDDIGRAYAQETAAALNNVAKDVRVLDLSLVWPEMPVHGDVSDLISTFGPDEAVRLIVELISVTPLWEPTQQELSQAETHSATDGMESKTGQAVTIDNIKSVLKALDISLRYNQLLKETEVGGLPNCYSSENAVNILPVFLVDYLKTHKYKGISQQTIDGYLNCIADQNRYNPVHDYLSSGRWDGKDRFTEIFRILGVNLPKYHNYIRKWFIQCVALALNDNDNPVSAEGVLVFQGEQGLAKTSFFRVISPCPRWFVEGAVIDIQNKDTLIKALSGWIVELGELDSTLKREQSALKAFITSPDDRIRIPYARNHTRTPRRTSFCGTVNPSDYLRDETGSRRFWTIPLTDVDKKALFALPREFINQLWYQTYQMYLAAPNGFRLTDDEMKTIQADNQGFSVSLPFELEIKELLDYALPVNEWQWWRAGELAKERLTHADAVKVGRALARVVLDQNTPPTPLKNPRVRNGNKEYLIPLKHCSENWWCNSGVEVG